MTPVEITYRALLIYVLATGITALVVLFGLAADDRPPPTVEAPPVHTPHPPCELVDRLPTADTARVMVIHVCDRPYPKETEP